MYIVEFTSPNICNMNGFDNETKNTCGIPSTIVEWIQLKVYGSGISYGSIFLIITYRFKEGTETTKNINIIADICFNREIEFIEKMDPMNDHFPCF